MAPAARHYLSSWWDSSAGHGPRVRLPQSPFCLPLRNSGSCTAEVGKTLTRAITWAAPFTMDEDEWSPRRKREPKPAKPIVYTREELVAELQRRGLAAPDLRVVSGGRS